MNSPPFTFTPNPNAQVNSNFPNINNNPAQSFYPMQYMSPHVANIPTYLPQQNLTNASFQLGSMPFYSPLGVTTTGVPSQQMLLNSPLTQYLALNQLLAAQLIQSLGVPQSQQKFINPNFLPPQVQPPNQTIQTQSCNQNNKEESKKMEDTGDKRKKRNKRTIATMNEDKVISMEGSSKIQKTPFLDLQFKLDSCNHEADKLRSSLSERDKKLEEMKRQMMQLIEQNKQQKQRIETMEQMQREELVHDTRNIRDLKQKLQYMQQLEIAFSERMARKAKEEEEIAKNLVKYDEENEKNQSQEPWSNHEQDPQQSDQMSNSPPRSGKRAGLKLSSESQPKAPLSPQGVYDPSWKFHGEIAAPFREKIDFSKIALKTHGIPTNFVEQAKKEHEEAQRQWQQQQIEVTIHNQSHNNLTKEGIPPPFYVIPSAFTEKIDLKDQISKLRKTNTLPQLSDAPIVDTNEKKSIDLTGSPLNMDELERNQLELFENLLDTSNVFSF